MDGAEGREDYILQVLQSVEPDVLVFQELFTESLVHHLAYTLKMAAFFGTVRIFGRKGVSQRLYSTPFPSLTEAWPFICSTIKARLRHGYQ